MRHVGPANLWACLDPHQLLRNPYFRNESEADNDVESPILWAPSKIDAIVATAE